MFHHNIPSKLADTPRKKRREPRRRAFGLREIILVAIAFALLALLPTSAQFGRNVEVHPADAFGSAENPGENFPGSAFYFMDQKSLADAAPPAYPSNDILPIESTSDAPLAALTEADIGNLASPVLDIPGVGPSASPFIIRPGSVGYSRALKCLSDAIYYEAANEPDAGQRAVAQVIINRMRHPTYPNSICGVIYQGSERQSGCQFSYSCDGSMARIPAAASWLRGQRVAMQALAGYVFAPVGMATHYHANYVYPYWAPSLQYVGSVGAHRFYKWKGSAGRPSAFFARYNGSEPFPGPKPRVWTPSAAPMLDPIELQKQYEREYAAVRLKAEADATAAARASIQPAPLPQPYADITPSRQRAVPQYTAPSYSAAAQAKGGEKTYSGGNLPSNANVKSEFQTSGSWKKMPSGG